MANDRALGLLGLARKGGNIQLGEENVGAACRAGHARLLLLAADATENTAKRARSWSRDGKPPLLALPYGKEALGLACGRAVCAMAALTDVSLALAFVKALGREEDAALQEELARRVERVKKRREEKRHSGKAVKRGKQGKK